MSPRYVIVTPARDEVATIEGLAANLFAQSVPFERWVVVNDGSTDGTTEALDAIARQDERVVVIERPPREERSVGIGGIESTMVGMSSMPDLFAFDYVANIDADVSIEPDYFEKLFARFDSDPLLGIAGGQCYSPTASGLVRDKAPEDHVHGATKVYRRECLRDIWPLAVVWGWDAVDEGRAQMRGWHTRSFADPFIIHAKPMSGGTGQVLFGKYVFGRTCHFLGYRPDFALLRAAMHLGRRPYILGGLAMGWGYLSGVLGGAEQIDDPSFVSYLRTRQAERMKSALTLGRLRDRSAT